MLRLDFIGTIALERQKIKKKLVEYSVEKKPGFPQDEIAAGKVAEQMDEEKIKQIIAALEAKQQ